MNEVYLDTARMLVQVAPLVFADDALALKGGTAINLFARDMPRLGDRLVVSIRHTKSGKPRIISCTPDMDAILERRKEARPDQDRVFPIPLITLKRKMKLLREKTGIQDVRLHDLRRTNATHLARAGVDLRTLSGRIGHRDLTMLHAVYSVFDKDDQAADAAQRIFGGLATMPEDQPKPQKKIAKKIAKKRRRPELN